MRNIIVAIIVVNIVCFFREINKVNFIEGAIYQMYVNNFNEYISFDEKGNLFFCEEKINEKFLEKGYKIKFASHGNSNLKFKVCSKGLIKWERTYLFYLVKNNETK